ncbi:MAG: GNAT family N-acetyltransferase [Alphaproteobacteria bacterium]
MTETKFTIAPAESAEDIAAIKALILQYNRILDIDLRFQRFMEEMRVFPATYELVLGAKRDGAMIGCICLKRLDQNTCEMKRMFVDPSARGLGVGRALALAVIEAAKARGFAEMKLDSLERLKPATALYRGLGFKETAPYNTNPEPDVVYFALPL